MALKAHTRGREMQLVQLPRFEDLSSSWHKQHLRKWSPQHYMSVASSNVDATTAKGIWKSKDEAWSGIDKVLPTDTRYEYQSLHSGHGQEAKMMAFLDHAHHQLKLLKFWNRAKSDSDGLIHDWSTKGGKVGHDGQSHGDSWTFLGDWLAPHGSEPSITPEAELFNNCCEPDSIHSLTWLCCRC